DLGGAVKGFRSAMKDGEEDKNLEDQDENVVDADVIDSAEADKKPEQDKV
ncbi:MAG: twin-arginine translocase subunit TatA, partial [Gammaproteobacteria bacterium]|nr:twin-arginine translocase subunit TatA [Gammaproteobacteria bacterium]